MAPKKSTKGKKVAKAPLAASKTVTKPKHPLSESRPKNFGIGQDIQPKRNLARYVKWPKYVRLQRQRRVLMQRLKVPPAISQFAKTADKNLATNVIKMLNKYRPEDKAAKKERLVKMAEDKAADKKKSDASKPYMVKSGVNHVVQLIEEKKAKLVIIAHDVDPIEIVLVLPALCRKMDIPYCILKGKSRLGQVVHKKTATALAITDVRPEDKAELAKLVDSCKAAFNDKYEERRKSWGGGIMGIKSNHQEELKKKIVAAEEAKRAAQI